MCRLFGFRSVIPSQVHSSLLVAENALGTQSNNHPDGWGVAYYVDNCPQLTRSASYALGDQLFHRLSGVVSSETVLAHVRKATQGEISVLNCHPFQYGRWTFAHNGDIPNFAQMRSALMDCIAPRLRRFILGDTDSEVIFYMLLSQLERFGPLHRPHLLEEVIHALRSTVQRVRSICDRAGTTSLMTLLVSDGSCLAAVHGGKELFVSTHKARCGERERCASFTAECEAPSSTGFVNHFIVSSEPLQGENVWEELSPGDVVAVDARMKLRRTRLQEVGLPVVV